MNNTIINTSFILPQSIVSNGATTGNLWLNPNNILFADNLFTESDSSSGSASDIIIGNYNTNLPQNAIVTGIEMKVIGYVGSVTIPLTTLDINMIDNTSGTDVPYPYVTPFTGFTTTNAEYTLGGQNYLFGQQSLTVDQVNNIKFQLIANGDLYIDSFLVNVYYYIPEPIVPPTPVPSGCMDCDSPIQLQAMYLYTPFQIGQTKFYLQKGSLQYPDGTPVQPGDVGSCGGDIDFVFDPGQKKGTGNNFEENVQLSLNSGSWTVLSSGVIEVDIGSINKRGLGFHTPYAHSADLMSDHDANSKVIISNSGKFYSRFPRLCQVDIVFSAPINVKDEGTTTVTSIHDINFIGANVQAEQDPIDPHQANVTIVSNPTNLQPTIESTTTGTTGTTPALTLSIPHTITSANYLRVGISTNDKVISSVTYNGISMNLVGQKSNGPADLKVAMYDLVNPTIGTFPIVVTMPTLSDISIVNISYLNVDTTNPTTGISGGAIGTGTAPTDSVTTTVQNAIVTDVVGTVHNVTTFAHVSPWVINGHVDACSRPVASSDRRVLLPSLVQDIYTISPASAWAILCYGIRGITTPSGGVNSVTGLDTDNSDPANPIVKISVDGTTITGTGTPLDPLVSHSTGGGSGTALQSSPITQASHGFTIGYPTPVRMDSTGLYVKSLAVKTSNSDLSGEFIGTAVASTVNTFVIYYNGQVPTTTTPFSALPQGTPLYISATTAGTLTDIEPTGTTDISKPIGYVDIATGASARIVLHNMRGLVGSNTSGGGSFSGTQSIEDITTNTSNFTDTSCAYNPIDGSIWEWRPNAFNLVKRYLLNSGNSYQPIASPSYTGITVPVGGTFNTVAPVIYNGNAYLLATVGTGGSNVDIKFRVIRLSDGANLGETNAMVNINIGAGESPTSVCATNNGRVVVSTAFNGFKHVYESDITSTLVLSTATTYITNASQSFGGAPLNYASYKKTSNSIYFIQNQYYNYGTATYLDGSFPVNSKVIFMGTTLDNKTIIGRQVANAPQGNPSSQPGTYIVISYWDTVGATTGITYNL